jgi:hypothetical protein
LRLPPTLLAASLYEGREGPLIERISPLLASSVAALVFRRRAVICAVERGKVCHRSLQLGKITGLSGGLASLIDFGFGDCKFGG